MKKASVRQLVHGFSKLQKSLAPGESVAITVHGKTVGQFTKTPTKTTQLPNFYENVRKTGAGPKVGDAIIKRLLAELDETVC